MTICRIESKLKTVHDSRFTIRSSVRGLGGDFPIDSAEGGGATGEAAELQKSLLTVLGFVVIVALLIRNDIESVWRKESLAF
jgi:hypothetical protein